MAVVTGTVTEIKIFQGPINILNQTDSGLVRVKDQATQLGETLLLWSTKAGECVPPSISLARSLNVSLLREALVNKLRVTISSSDDTSATVQTVALHAA